jgi:hypothetical protein
MIDVVKFARVSKYFMLSFSITVRNDTNTRQFPVAVVYNAVGVDPQIPNELNSYYAQNRRRQARVPIARAAVDGFSDQEDVILVSSILRDVGMYVRESQQVRRPLLYILDKQAYEPDLIE